MSGEVGEGMLTRYLYQGRYLQGSSPNEQNNNSGRFEKRRNHDRKPKLYKCRCEWKKLLSWLLWLSPSLKIKLPY